MKNNPLVVLSIFGIRTIWHGRFGRTYNQKKHVLCRFHPSCSNYAIMALEKYGFIRGWAMAINRIRRCNPYNLESCIDYP
ncbi:membrane protein insertion efficiency factor YidD [Methanospirillum sp.]|uniref:membrane protein insertion efficiency factor YidD n=1 Tax=Methanospirillum sp. TaxID=45200 RepID=UPI00345D7E07